MLSAMNYYINDAHVPRSIRIYEHKKNTQLPLSCISWPIYLTANKINEGYARGRRRTYVSRSLQRTVVVPYRLNQSVELTAKLTFFAMLRIPFSLGLHQIRGLDGHTTRHTRSTSKREAQDTRCVQVYEYTT